MKADESVLDFPKDGLCPDIWEKVMDEMGAAETWRPNTDVEDKILNIVHMLCDEAGLIYDNVRVFITGSITSNTYNKTADVDVHIRLVKPIREQPEDTQARVNEAMKALDAEWKAAGQDPDEVKSWNGHPLQFYYQPDEFQDFMSVGVYDVKNKQWLVGPELRDQSYNPYSELYKDIQAKAGNLIRGIRDKILDVYEKAVVFTKVATHAGSQPSDADVIQQTFIDLLGLLKSASELYENARQMRKAYSSPTSIEQALQFRSSKKWKVADAAFKLMDKFGYLAILKQYNELYSLVSDGEYELAVEAAESVLSTVKKYISNPEKLADSEKLSEDGDNPMADVLQHPTKSMLPDQLYHVFPAKYLSSVKSRGIVPSIESKSEKQWDQSGNDITYWSRSLVLAKTYWSRGDIKAVSVPMSEFDYSKLYIDRNYWVGFDAEVSFEYHGFIQASKCHFLTDEEVQQRLDYEKDAIQSGELDIGESEQVDEGAKEMLTTAAIVALLAVKNICPAASLEAALKDVPKSEMRASSSAFKQAVAKATKGKSYNGMNVTNIVNCVARTIYAEAKGEGEKGQAAVASVIWNRAGGKCSNLVDVVLKDKQFSCWNEKKPGKTDKDYALKIPAEAINQGKSKDIWDNCVKLATQLATEEFTSTIGNRNSYMNKATASEKAKKAWGGKLDLKIGKHDFGYLSCNDGFKGKTAAPPSYVVKAGDTLSMIAKTNKTTVDALQKKNSIKDPNKISVGQKILL